MAQELLLQQVLFELKGIKEAAQNNDDIPDKRSPHKIRARRNRASKNTRAITSVVMLILPPLASADRFDS
jgi:hypothetical protein